MPLFSIFAVASGSAALIHSFSNAAFVVSAASPVVVGALGIIGAVNTLRDRPKLSKAFAAASAVSSVATLSAFSVMLQAPGAEGLMAFGASTMGMIVAGGLNIASHYTNRPDRTSLGQDVPTPKP
jgi:hypothetical protein